MFAKLYLLIKIDTQLFQMEGKFQNIPEFTLKFAKFGHFKNVNITDMLQFTINSKGCGSSTKKLIMIIKDKKSIF